MTTRTRPVRRALYCEADDFAGYGTAADAGYPDPDFPTDARGSASGVTTIEPDAETDADGVTTTSTMTMKSASVAAPRRYETGPLADVQAWLDRVTARTGTAGVTTIPTTAPRGVTTTHPDAKDGVTTTRTKRKDGSNTAATHAPSPQRGVTTTSTTQKAPRQRDTKPKAGTRHVWLRDMPEGLLAELTAAAQTESLSLPAYIKRVLTEHVAAFPPSSR